VKSHPGQAATHVELARAYTAAGQPQLASVEYLAATRIDAGTSKPTPPSPWSRSRRATPAWPTPSSPRAQGASPLPRGVVHAWPDPRDGSAPIRGGRQGSPGLSGGGAAGSHRTTVATVSRCSGAEPSSDHARLSLGLGQPGAPARARGGLLHAR
jgi:hypothetical protein